MAGAEDAGGLGGLGKYIPRQGTGIAGRMSTVAMLGAGVYTLPPTDLKLHGMYITAGTFGVYLVALLLYALRNLLHASLEGTHLVQAQLRQWEIAEKDKAPVVPAANVAPPEAAQARNEGGQR
jgi:hypothetical protein